MKDYNIYRETTTSTLQRIINQITSGFTFTTINLKESRLQKQKIENDLKNRESILETLIKILPNNLKQKETSERNKDLAKLEKSISIKKYIT